MCLFLSGRGAERVKPVCAATTCKGKHQVCNILSHADATVRGTECALNNLYAPLHCSLTPHN